MTYLDLIVPVQSELFELFRVEREQVGAGDVLVHEGGDVLLQTQRQQPLTHLAGSEVSGGQNQVRGSHQRVRWGGLSCDRPDRLVTW